MVELKTLKVVAAIIVHEGKILATQRGYGEWKGGWEFPGGKIEPGETPEIALKREIEEELELIVEVGELFDVVEYDYPEFHLSMKCFMCKIETGHLSLNEHQAAKWLTKDLLSTLDWLPADKGLISKLSGDESF